MSCWSQTRETENSKLEYYVEFDRKLHHYFLIVYTEIECHIDKKKVHERRKLQVAKTLLLYLRCYRCGLAEHLSMICKVLTLTKKSSIEGTERRKANERGINRRERANMQYKLKVNCTLLKTFQIWKKKWKWKMVWWQIRSCLSFFQDRSRSSLLQKLFGWALFFVHEK